MKQAIRWQEVAQRAAHDLGKPIAWACGWLPPDASVEDQREALFDDVWRTRRDPQGVRSAAAQWAALREALAEDTMSDDEDVRAIDGAINALVALGDDRASWSAADVERGRALALSVRAACQRWARRARG